MTATCPSCGCHQPDSLLCWQDTEALLTMFAAIPALVDELQVAISKQARVATGGKSGKGSAHTKSPINFGALAVRDALMVELALWGSDIDEIRRHPQAAEIVSGVGRVVKNAYRCIDRMADRKYLGTCLAAEDGAVCHAELWAKPGAHQVKCSQCETVHEVGDRREVLLRKAESLVCTPRDASSYIGEVGGIHIGQQRIRNYVDRHRIPNRAQPGEPMLLRMGDLLSVLREEAARHESQAS